MCEISIVDALVMFLRANPGFSLHDSVSGVYFLEDDRLKYRTANGTYYVVNIRRL